MATIPAPEARNVRRPSARKIARLRFMRSKPGMLGAAIVVGFVIIAFLAPFLAPYDPSSVFYLPQHRPQQGHPWGLDIVGRDLLSRMIWGSRTALYVGMGSALIMGLLGICIGAISGYRGGRTDEILMRFTDVFLVIPFLLVVMFAIKLVNIELPNSIFAAVQGFTLTVITLLLGLFGWPAIARLVRGEFLKFKEFEFVEAARCLGKSDRGIIFRHILPNAIPPVVVALTAAIGNSILFESALSFLGLGDSTVVSWGYQLYLAQQMMPANWWEQMFPGLMIFLAVLGFNILGDGLNDALNPRLR